jgi:hypothetical protein
MNKDLSACNGIIKGSTKNCPQKNTCKRFELHSQNNQNQSYIQVPFQAVIDKKCSFKM